MPVTQNITFTPNQGISANQQGVASATGLRIMGYAVRESAATPAVATLILRHGTTATDPVLFPIEVVANGFGVEWVYPGIEVPNGIFIEIVAGTIDITIFHETVT